MAFMMRAAGALAVAMASKLRGAMMVLKELGSVSAQLDGLGIVTAAPSTTIQIRALFHPSA
jgi:hypothetical protein